MLLYRYVYISTHNNHNAVIQMYIHNNHNAVIQMYIAAHTHTDASTLFQHQRLFFLYFFCKCYIVIVAHAICLFYFILCLILARLVHS